MEKSVHSGFLLNFSWNKYSMANQRSTSMFFLYPALFASTIISLIYLSSTSTCYEHNLVKYVYFITLSTCKNTYALSSFWSLQEYALMFNQNSKFVLDLSIWGYLIQLWQAISSEMSYSYLKYSCRLYVDIWSIVFTFVSFRYKSTPLVLKKNYWSWLKSVFIQS